MDSCHPEVSFQEMFHIGLVRAFYPDIFNQITLLLVRSTLYMWGFSFLLHTSAKLLQPWVFLSPAAGSVRKADSSLCVSFALPFLAFQSFPKKIWPKVCSTWSAMTLASWPASMPNCTTWIKFILEGFLSGATPSPCAQSPTASTSSPR